MAVARLNRLLRRRLPARPRGLVVVCLVVAAAFPVAGAPAPAAGAGPPDQAVVPPLLPEIVDLPELDRGSHQMIFAGGALWVSDADAIHVYSPAGRSVGSVTGLVRPGPMVSDGTYVYAVQQGGSAVAKIRVSDRTVERNIATLACPSSLALVAERLYYSYGCDLSDSGVAHVALDGGGSVVDLTAARAAVAGGERRLLVAEVPPTSPGVITSYAVGDDGSLGPRGSTPLGWGDAWAVSPDGRELAVGRACSREVSVYATEKMTIAGSYPASCLLVALAWSADSHRLALGGEMGYPSVMDLVTGIRRELPVVSVGLNTVQPGTLTFSADGSTVYALHYERYRAMTTLLAARVAPAPPSLVGVRVVPAGEPGGTAQLSVSTPGRPSTMVLLTLTMPVDPGSASGTRTLRTGPDGTLRIPLRLASNGTVTVSAQDPGDRAMASVSLDYTVPPSLTLALAGKHRTVRGVIHARAASDVRFLVKVGPARTVPLSTVVQYQLGGRWYSTAARTVTTNPSGLQVLYLRGSYPSRTLRLAVTFLGDGVNAASATVTTAPLVLDSPTAQAACRACTDPERRLLA